MSICAENNRMVNNQMQSDHTLHLWEQFVNSGKLPAGELNPVVAASWQRCYQQKVNPYDGKSHYILDDKELAQVIRERSELISIALPLMQDLNRYVAGSGFLVMVTDERGFILEVLGDRHTIDKAREINFIKGAAWTEKEVGTNAIGTVLEEKIPLQINSCEHYCRLHHVWTCSAAPIFNEQKQIIGILNMSGPSQEAHKHTLGMVVSAVYAIRHQMRVREKNRQLNIVNERMRNVFMTMSDGVIILEQNGHIVQVNPVAEKLLGRGSKYMEGQSYLKAFPEFIWIQDTLQNGQDFNDVETPLQGTAGTINCLASSKPMWGENAQAVNGAVIIFNPVKKIRNLVNRMSGAHASFNFHDIIGQNPKLLEAVQTAILAADKRSNILLQGESGTGKELFAQAIHNASSRKNGPFIALNCGAIPRELLGSELFGYVEGAFTGARRGGRPGKFELASGGTLFLDEIGEMPLGKQVSLLRAVQEKEISRIGDDKVIPVDVRIICATNKDLKAEVEKGNFRQDLYYRLNVIRIRLPSLRERREDIPLQFNYFLNQISQKMQIPAPRVEPAVIQYLTNYDWPGNVRELQNVVERMINICNGNTITVEHLPQEILNQFTTVNNNSAQTLSRGASVNMQRQRQKQMQGLMEQEEIIKLLGKYGGNITRVAQEMGISRNTVYRKMKKYNIEI